MNQIKNSHVLMALIIASLMVLGVFTHPVKSWGFDTCSYYYEALLDTDNNTATGGAVSVVQAGEQPHDINGIDYRVIVNLNICNNQNQLGPIMVLKWNSNTLAFDEQANYDTFYNIGIENGDLTLPGHYADVIEFRAAKTDIGNPGGSMKIVYHASRQGPNDYTAAFYYPQQTSIPTFSQWGMLLLSLLLSGSAVLVMRKRRTVPVKLICALVIIFSLSGAAWAIVDGCGPITLDGLVNDWNCNGINSAVTDPIGDSSVGDYGEDIFKGYITSDDTNVYFRVDIVGGQFQIPN